MSSNQNNRDTKAKTSSFSRRLLALTPWVLAVLFVPSRHATAQPLILIEGHVDIGVIYSGEQLAWRFNADGASSEGGNVGDLAGLYAADELVVRVPTSVRFSSPPFPGNPNVTGSGSGPFWILPSSGGLSNVPFLGWSWDFGISSPPQLNLSQWQNSRITIELMDASMPTEGNFSVWVGGTNYLSTFNPSLTNAPNVPAGSNSLVLQSHNHYNWGFTRAGVYDLTFRASGTHLSDGSKSSEATFRFLVGDETELPGDSATVVGASIVHSGWTGQGESIDTQKQLAKEGLGPRTLDLVHLINSSHGINGLAFDIQDLGDASSLSLSDFVFQMSPQETFDPNDHPPEQWTSAPEPSSMEVVAGSPSRILVRWPNNSIINRWMRVSLLATPSTGLAELEVYYVGHLLGETTGVDGGLFTVNFSDISAIRSLVGQTVEAGNAADIDKNGSVSFGDIGSMRSNVGTQLPAIAIE